MDPIDTHSVRPQGRWRVAVTGATGLLGAAVCRALIARGATPVALVRRPAAVPEGAEVRTVTFADPAGLRAALAGADALVHCAAIFARGGVTMAAYEAANVDAVGNVLAGASSAGVRRVIHVSSTAVGGPEGGPDAQGWAVWRRRYAVSKARGEAVAWQRATALQLKLTVVRPCSLYGPGDRMLRPSLRALLRGPLLAVPDLPVALLHAEDAAEVVLDALGAPETVGRGLVLAGPAVGLATLLRWTRDAEGLTMPRVLGLPVPWTRPHVPCDVAIGLGLRAREHGPAWRTLGG